MKHQPTAIVLGITIGLATQLQCCAAVAAAEQEPGVPVEAPVDSAPTDSVPTDSAGNSAPPSPMVPPLNYSETYPHGAPMQGRLLQVDTTQVDTTQVDTTLESPVVPERESKDSEPESKSSLLGKIGKSLLKGGTNRNVPIAERPWWIPGNAFTDDSMVAPYHNLDIAWWDKRPMPNRPQWVRLSTSVTRYWKRGVTEPCFVRITPMEQVPGNFTFRSRSPFGPRGWLQALGTPDRKGFPQYRYWLDQP